MARTPTQKLLTQIPGEYQPDFIDRLNRNYKLSRVIQARRAAIEADLGGAEHLSYGRRSLVKRLVWLECVVETKEQQLANGEQVDLGGYTQALNSLLGLFRMLGLERKVRTVRTLRQHMEGRA